jgi:hypothetical protein
MKRWTLTGLATAIFSPLAFATTIMVVPIFEPISLHSTDGDEAISEVGDALQASVMSRPMALSGAFPETLIDAVRSPHPMPTNSPNYTVKETNLLVLCNIGIRAEMMDKSLIVSLDVAQLAIPPEVDLTTRQILKLAMIAVKKTLEDYQRPQPEPLKVSLRILGTDAAKASLLDLGTDFVIGEPLQPN